MGKMISVAGCRLTEGQVIWLRKLAAGPVDLEPLGGFDARTLSLLEDKGLASIEATQALVTPKGRTAAASLAGAAERAKPASKPAASKPSNSRGFLSSEAIAEMRAQIAARYEADLAALDRLAAIAETIERDGAAADA